MKLTKNFSLDEMSKSMTAERLGIDNTPNDEIIKNLKLLCEKILQPLRDEIGSPIRVSSGYRSPALNTAIGGSSKTSDHIEGLAGDISNPSGDNKLLFDLIIEMDLPFKQLIWEFGDDKQPQWIHVSVDPLQPKNEVLKAYKKDGRTKYERINII